MDGQAVFLAHNGGGHVHHLEVAGVDFVVGDFVEFGGCGVFFGVGGVDAIHASAFEHHLGFHFYAAEGRAGVGGEEGIAGAARHDCHFALLHGFDGAPFAILFADGKHIDGCEHL